MFENQKKTFLEKEDKSLIGSIDEEIKELVNKINNNPNYYTTSSCSGRIVIIEGKRKPAKWLFVSHKEISHEKIKEKLTNLTEGEIWFRQEPMIMHVACKTIKDAQKLINIAREIGFKRSGIQATNNKVIIEIASTEFIDTIIADKRKLLVTEEYLRILTEKANEKLRKNMEKINKFKNSLF